MNEDKIANEIINELFEVFKKYNCELFLCTFEIDKALKIMRFGTPETVTNMALTVIQQETIQKNKLGSFK